jgi:hypothetical protein
MRKRFGSRTGLRLAAALLALTMALGMLAGCALDDLIEIDTLPVSSAATTAAAETLRPETTKSRTEETTLPPETTAEESTEALPDEHGVYTTKEDVALYLHVYGRLPENFITKNQARALGWPGGGLDAYAPGKCIGGDRFGNNEKLLPEAQGRVYRECDIDTLGASSRGAKRIVYSNDGLIYYTEDHYGSFTLLYGDEA